MFLSSLLAIGAALNLLFTSSDLFNLYVGLELLTFAAIPLVSLKGSAETLRAALRYLLFAVFGSMLYLLGIVLIYGAYGTLDIAMLAARVRPDGDHAAGRGPCHGGASGQDGAVSLPPLASARPCGRTGGGKCGALGTCGEGQPVPAGAAVVRRAARRSASLQAMQLLASLGAAAVILGSVTALRQARLKLLVAYSTVAQIGYMFFVFTLVPIGTG